MNIDSLLCHVLFFNRLKENHIYKAVVEWDPHSLSFCAVLSWNFIVFQTIQCSIYQHYHKPWHLSMACLAFHPILRLLRVKGYHTWIESLKDRS